MRWTGSRCSISCSSARVAWRRRRFIPPFAGRHSRVRCRPTTFDPARANALLDQANLPRGARRHAGDARSSHVSGFRALCRTDAPAACGGGRRSSPEAARSGRLRDFRVHAARFRSRADLVLQRRGPRDRRAPHVSLGGHWQRALLERGGLPERGGRPAVRPRRLLDRHGSARRGLSGDGAHRRPRSPLLVARRDRFHLGLARRLRRLCALERAVRRTGVSDAADAAVGAWPGRSVPSGWRRVLRSC